MTAPAGPGLPTDFVVFSIWIDPSPVSERGRTILARLNVRYGPINLIGCVLVLYDGGGMALWTPGASDGSKVVVDREVRKSILEGKAIEAYRTVTGRDPRILSTTPNGAGGVAASAARRPAPQTEPAVG